MREYHSPEPIILSVGEEDEISIADVARCVASKFHCLRSSCDQLCMQKLVLLLRVPIRDTFI